MTHIATSQSRFFLAADSLYDGVATLFRRAMSHPKVAFRIVFSVAVFGTLFALMNLGIDASADHFRKQDFMERHSAMLKSMEAAPSTQAAGYHFTLEQRLIAVKMFECVSTSQQHSEARCSVRLVADAGVAGGEDRARAVGRAFTGPNFTVPAELQL